MSIILPFFGDQPFWGRLLHSLGVGTEPVPRKKLTVDKLAAAIREAVSNPDLLENAEKIGQRIQQEDGVGRTMDIIEKIMKKRPSE